MYRCETCKGEYSKVCGDGLEYYHACPDIEDVDYKTKPITDKRDENIRKKLPGKGATKIS